MDIYGQLLLVSVFVFVVVVLSSPSCFCCFLCVCVVIAIAVAIAVAIADNIAVVATFVISGYFFWRCDVFVCSCGCRSS